MSRYSFIHWSNPPPFHLRMQKSHLKRHELLFSRTFKSNYPASAGLNHKHSAIEEFVAFQMRFLHSWAMAWDITDVCWSGRWVIHEWNMTYPWMRRDSLTHWSNPTPLLWDMTRTCWAETWLLLQWDTTNWQMSTRTHTHTHPLTLSLPDLTQCGHDP